MPRRLRIRKEYLGTYCHTVGFLGRRAVDRGLVAVGHTEACRNRIAEELEKKGDERILEQTARFREYGTAIRSEEEKRGKPTILEESRKTKRRDMTKEDLDSKQDAKISKLEEKQKSKKRDMDSKQETRNAKMINKFEDMHRLQQSFCHDASGCSKEDRSECTHIDQG